MCGILGIATARGREPSLDDRSVARLRDLMTHRGPDDAGLWRRENVVLAHRRLSVLDPTPGGRQPMVSPDGLTALVYNGELYNDAELRGELEAEGVVFRTSCDTETVLHALTRWGAGALPRFRGMFALGFYDARAHTLTLARDPFGIKPLYYCRAGTELVFASEVAPILAHPAVTPEPDFAGVSAYLSTIRTTIGERTLFAGVRTLLPGQVLTFDLSGDELRVTSSELPAAAQDAESTDLRAVVEGSVRAHLRSDRPLCCLLSGGLDSSICAHGAAPLVALLHTYCSGAPDAEAVDGVPQSEDFAHARLVADAVGSVHTEAPVSRGLFAERWGQIVSRTGVPLSTPNEVAINEVARTLRTDGHIVTLSGEGADEMFGGYDRPLRLAAAHVAAGNDDPGLFQLASTAWVPPDTKPSLLREHVWRGLDGDAHLVETYRETYRRVAVGTDDPLDAHLRFLRRVNLAGLLLRLDSATMLESVEGRTPFADVRVAGAADALPMARRFSISPDGANTKTALREAFAGDLPEAVVRRPKASFPLPFQRWVGDRADALGHPLLAELFTEAAIEAVRANPSGLWSLAWGMVNLGMWAARWWGAQCGVSVSAASSSR